MTETTGVEVVLSDIAFGKEGKVTYLKPGDKVPADLSKEQKEELRAAGAIGKAIAVVDDSDKVKELESEIEKLKAEIAAKEAAKTPETF